MTVKNPQSNKVASFLIRALTVESGDATRARTHQQKERAVIGNGKGQIVGAFAPQIADDLLEVVACRAQHFQVFSSVREALADLIQSGALIGIVQPSYTLTPKQLIADFYKRSPTGNIDVIYAEIIKNAPTLKEAHTVIAQTQADVDQAKLDLRYCTIVPEIDGVVTRRNVNPGDYVQVGQSLMAVRSGASKCSVCSLSSGWLLGRGLDGRWLIDLGLLIMAASGYWMSQMNLDISPGQVVWPRNVLILGLGMVFAPLNVAAYLYIPQKLRGAAVGLFALLRNEGGSFGTSMAQTVVERREQFHVLRLNENLDPLNPAVTSFLGQVQPGFFSTHGRSRRRQADGLASARKYP